MIYTDEYRKQVIQKLLRPGGPTVSELSHETGITRATLYRWRMDSENGHMSKRKSKNPRKWPLEQKYAALIEAKSKSDDELGSWLREKGLHSEHLELWEKEIAATLGAMKSSREKDHAREIASLKKEIERKDKALAEVSALLVLKKKFQTIMGEEEQLGK